MIVCPRCSKENQDHYKFCLGCGAELPREAASPKGFTAPTPPSGVAARQPGPVQAPPAAVVASVVPAPVVAPAPVVPAPVSPAPMAAPAPVVPAPVVVAASTPPAAAAPMDCPKCGTSVPSNFKFCGGCGNDMTAVRAAAAVAPVVAPAAVAPSPAKPGRLVLIRPDGSEGDTFALDAQTDIGRDAGGVFSGDTYLSPKHAHFSLSTGSAKVKDLGSLNGIYLKVLANAPVELTEGSVFRIGQEILRFEKLTDPKPRADGTQVMGSPDQGANARVRLVTGRAQFGNAYCVPSYGMQLGRERGDVIFPEDGYVSGLHCRIHSEGGKHFLTDLGSSNGTFIRLREESEIPAGSLVLMGQQLFRVEC